jgi:hypothetical protein
VKAGLYLVGSTRGQRYASATRCKLPPYDLDRQPQRPGELCSELCIDAIQLAAQIHARAARAGLPSSLWSTLAAESRRCVEVATGLLGLSPAEVRGLLDTFTGREQPLSQPAVSRLGDYAHALLAAQPRTTTPSVGPLLLRPSATQLTAWSLAAARNSVDLDAWILQRLQDTPGNMVGWEAAAALAGQTLLEWTLAQTARRLRPASTPAHSAG